MKLTVCLSASLFALLAASFSARADTPNDTPLDNPYANLDPDGVPLAVVNPQQRPTVQDVTDMQQMTQQEQRQRDWLLLDYEDVERNHEKQTSNETSSSDIYLELSQNKDLAQLAGLTPLEPLPPAPPPPRASPGTSAGGGLSLRPEAPPATGALTPLVSPWSSSAASAATPYFITAYSAPLPSDLAPTVALDSPSYDPPPAAADTSQPPAVPSPSDTIDLQTPGMVAAKDNPIPGTPDLNLDSLPDQNQDDSPTHQPTDEPPQLAQSPHVMDESALHLELNARLKVPNPVAARAAASQPQANTTPVAQPEPVKEVPMPVTQQPQLSPVHAPVQNPYDILNR